MAKNCLYFCTDRGYLFTTILSATQARAQAAPDTADIYIVGIDLDPDSLRLLSTICEQERIQYVHASSATFENLPGMYGRFFFHRLVPKTYRSYFYVDGDTQFTGSLEDLFAVELPPGQLMAAADPMAFMALEKTHSAEEFRQYLREIGLPPNHFNRYFNSGAVYAAGDGWSDICERSLTYVREGKHLGIWPDQSALNAVAQDCFIPLSLRWNFPIYMKNCGVYEAIQPRIMHFMSNPKPWNGAFPPWDTDASTPYDLLVRKYPVIGAYRKAFSPARRVKYHLQQRYKIVTETITWKYSARRTRILDYEKECAAALASLVQVPAGL